MVRDYLPISKEDMEKRGWEQCDFVYVIGDAYVDHHSFGPAIISRVLESNGYKVGIIAQPDWKDNDSITILGTPRLGFLVCGGNMDTMVNHYSVSKRRRQMDAYSPGGETGKRPDRATIVYCNMIRNVYKNAPIIIGGIEASLRRLAHYDYWSDKVKRSILLDSQADLISYGMGEHSIVEIADALDSGLEVKDITFIDGTVYKAKNLDSVYDVQILPSFEEILESKEVFAKSFYTQYCNTDPFTGKRLAEQYKENEYVVQNPPSKPLTQAEMDRVYSLPYMRDFHPSYIEKGGIPAIEELKFSLVSNRGCFGGCSFCALTFHQGRIIQARSHESILAEANNLIWDKDFKGYINDVGGPTANFRHVACEKQLTKGACINKQCLYPTPCKNLKIDHKDYLELLRKLRSLPNVKKVFIRSGIRFDYLIKDKDETFMRELCEHHISGQLKVAPEHISDKVLELMGKPMNSVYEEFLTKFKQMNVEVDKNQFVVPYLMSSHPGSTLKEAVALAEYLRDLGYMPEQVQDFYPTPSTISTCMYYTGLDPRTMEPIYVPKTQHEKAMQRALIQYRNPKNFELVVEALTKANRTDLIGFDKNCLVRPRRLSKEKYQDEQREKVYMERKNDKDMKYNKDNKNNSSRDNRSNSGSSPRFNKDNQGNSGSSPKFSKDNRSDSGPSPRFNRDNRSNSGSSPRFNKDSRSDSGSSPRFNKDNRSDSGSSPRFNKDSQSNGGSNPRFNKDNRSDSGSSPRFNKDNRSDSGSSPRFNKDSRSDSGPSPRFNKDNRSDSGSNPRFNKDNRSDSGSSPRFNKDNRSDSGSSPRFNKDNRSDSGSSPRFNKDSRSDGGSNPRFNKDNRSDSGSSPRFNKDNRSDSGSSPRFNKDSRSDSGSNPRFNKDNRSDSGSSPRFNKDNRSDSGSSPRFNKDNRSDSGSNPRFNKDNRSDSGSSPRFNKDSRSDSGSSPRFNKDNRSDSGSSPRFNKDNRSDSGSSSRFNKDNRSDSGSSPRFNKDNRSDSGSNPRFNKDNRSDSGSSPRFNKDNRSDSGSSPRFNKDSRSDSGSSPRFNKDNRSDSGSSPRFNKDNRSGSGPSPRFNNDNRSDNGSSPRFNKDNRSDGGSSPYNKSTSSETKVKSDYKKNDGGAKHYSSSKSDYKPRSSSSHGTSGNSSRSKGQGRYKK